MKNAQISEEDAKCIICREGITNPICPECLAKEIRYWNPEVGKGLATPKSGGAGNVKCLFCGRDMTICAHCYCRDIYDWIIIEKPELGDEFIDIFDFGLKEELI